MIILPWKRHKYIRVYNYTDKKTITVEYHKIKGYNPSFLINPDHIFNMGGYQCILTCTNACETLNPLDFKSQFNPKDYQTAIESKIIKETFSELKTSKIDLMKVLLFANLGITVILLYLLLKGNGAI